MGKAKPIEQNMVLQRIIEYLKEHEQSFPEQISREVGCNSRNVLIIILNGTRRFFPLNVWAETNEPT